MNLIVIRPQARLVREKSMIGRLQNELVSLNGSRSAWEDAVIAAAADLTAAQAQVLPDIAGTSDCASG